LTFEKCLKVTPYRRVKGVNGRYLALNHVINKERWSQKRDLACKIPLTVYFFEQEYYDKAIREISFPEYVKPELVAEPSITDETGVETEE
jgi:hypothetical protein